MIAVSNLLLYDTRYMHKIDRSRHDILLFLPLSRAEKNIAVGKLANFRSRLLDI